VLGVAATAPRVVAVAFVAGRILGTVALATVLRTRATFGPRAALGPRAARGLRRPFAASRGRCVPGRDRARLGTRRHLTFGAFAAAAATTTAAAAALAVTAGITGGRTRAGGIATTCGQRIGTAAGVGRRRRGASDGHGGRGRRKVRQLGLVHGGANDAQRSGPPQGRSAHFPSCSRPA
jgi:hypothetical protein